MYRLLTICVLVAGLIFSAGCSGGSALDNNSAAVFLTVEIEQYNPEVNVCAVFGDLTIESLSIESKPKNPDITLTANQDVNLRDWDITVRRTDGGTVTSPDWYIPVSVFVPGGGTASLENYRIYPEEFLADPPFNYLFPENGGLDPETGASVVREGLHLVISGRVVSGKAISTEPVEVSFRFHCN
ncbi:MAG: hypothetical protein DRJ65_14990 [Acidobacteria bacterium]|nr:MAG: hypothetical protein DRJ65_14990 [Acidobacteriota bacterium]